MQAWDDKVRRTQRESHATTMSLDSAHLAHTLRSCRKGTVIGYRRTCDARAQTKPPHLCTRLAESVVRRPDCGLQAGVAATDSSVLTPTPSLVRAGERDGKPNTQSYTDTQRQRQKPTHPPLGGLLQRLVLAILEFPVNDVFAASAQSGGEHVCFVHQLLAFGAVEVCVETRQSAVEAIQTPAGGTEHSARRAAPRRTCACCAETQTSSGVSEHLSRGRLFAETCRSGVENDSGRHKMAKTQPQQKLRQHTGF